jgi:hypothetical protein
MAIGLTGSPEVLIVGKGYLLGQNRAMPSAPDFSPNTDELVANNSHFVADFRDAGLALAPKRHLAIVACMDSRMDIFQMLGLAHGDAHIIRNAGGVVTDDVIRSLVVSQRLLNTQEVILIHHTNCGLQTISDDGFKKRLPFRSLGTECPQDIANHLSIPCMRGEPRESTYNLSHMIACIEGGSKKRM